MIAGLIFVALAVGVVFFVMKKKKKEIKLSAPTWGGGHSGGSGSTDQPKFTSNDE
jgi:uncharacterized membrane protein